MPHQTPPERPSVVPYEGSQQQHVDTAIETIRSQVTESTAFLWTGGKEAQVIADLLLYAVGDTHEKSPVPFVTVSTGNHYEEMVSFRERYASGGDIGPQTGVSDWRVLRHDKLIDGVLQNDSDPRCYHGEWDDSVSLPDTDPSGVDALPRSPDSWTVESSCGVAKVVPIRRLIDAGYDTLITGRRGDDPLTPGEANSLDCVKERSTPAPHKRINPLAEWSEPNVYAYLKSESAPLPSLYTDHGFRHTDSECCVDEDSLGEYGEGGRDPQKRQAEQRLEDMGYV